MAKALEDITEDDEAQMTTEEYQVGLPHPSRELELNFTGILRGYGHVIEPISPPARRTPLRPVPGRSLSPAAPSVVHPRLDSAVSLRHDPPLPPEARLPRGGTQTEL